MLQVALYEPEIPPNTGNIIRLCANAGAELHLIHPLGFAPDDKQVKRAGLDYHEWVRVQHQKDYAMFLQAVAGRRIFACSTHGQRSYADVSYLASDVLLFGPETRGLPKAVLEQLPPEQIIRIPMLPNSRSLNLSNAVAIIVYEALRQQGFAGLTINSSSI
jgi:tRNA (cytidine/uridine-2'-O-)-methyltransferase